MLTRTLHTSTVGRAAAIRRQRRRSAVSHHLYCGTNGCASFLEVDPESKVATCPICGYRRHLN